MTPTNNGKTRLKLMVYNFKDYFAILFNLDINLTDHYSFKN